MAKRPVSGARGVVRDARAFEERRCLNRAQIGVLIVHLRRVVRAAPRDEMLLAEAIVWLRVRDAFAVLLLLLSGLRRFELCGLTVGDFNAASAKLLAVGKGKLLDHVPLPQPAVDLLLDWLAFKRLRGESLGPEAPLFCASGADEGGGFMSVSALRLRWKIVLAEAGLPTTFGVHATRHAAGLLVYAHTGGDLGKTARFLRHRDTATTSRHYMHIDGDQLRRELSTVDEWRSS